MEITTAAENGHFSINDGGTTSRSSTSKTSLLDRCLTVLSGKVWWDIEIIGSAFPKSGSSTPSTVFRFRTRRFSSTFACKGCPIDSKLAWASGKLTVLFRSDSLWRQSRSAWIVSWEWPRTITAFIVVTITKTNGIAILTLSKGVTLAQDLQWTLWKQPGNRYHQRVRLKRCHSNIASHARVAKTTLLWLKLRRTGNLLHMVNRGIENATKGCTNAQ